MSSYTSKFRHIYGDPAKNKNQYCDIKNPMTSGESTYIKANAKFFAVGSASGGAPVYIRKLTDVGRGTEQKYISTNKGRLTDFAFHPFIDTMIATAGDDCKININKFPKEGLTENVRKAEIEIKGHKKKISLIQFNPAANNIIASAGYDRTVKVFNIETATPLTSYDAFKDNIYSLEWNGDGSMLGTTGKDKVLRVFDPRKPEEAIILNQAFEGIKSTKCFFVNKYNWIGSTGFSKSAKRQLKIWDLRNPEKTIYHLDIDSASSVLTTKMDNDLNVLYLAGKGDNSVTFYELNNDDKICRYLSAYRDGIPQKGGGWIPKRGLDVFKCEVQRFLKLTKNSVIPVSFVVPRKSGSDVFQDDIYPACASPRAAQQADDWSAGDNAEVLTMSMNPEERDDNDNDDNTTTFNKKKTYDEVCIENVELQNKVKSLEEEIERLKKQLNDNKQDDDENKDDK